MLDFTDIKFFKLAVGQDRIGHETEIDINAKCPICGDSRIHRNVKRLHLYQKGDVTLVNCFNGDCPCQNKTMYNFLKTFYPNLLFQYKQEKFFKDIENLKSKKEEPLDLSVNYDFFKVQKAEDLPSSKIVTQDLSQFFKPLEQSKEAIQYLNLRGFSLNDIKNLGQWYFGTCKTQTSYRTIPIGETLLNALKEYKKEQEENKKNYGDSYMKHYKKNVINPYNNKQEIKILNAYAELQIPLDEVDFVFVKKNGVYEGTDSCKYPFKVIHYELGIHCRFHDFRDTHATKLIESGADIKAVSKRLGHSSIMTTYNIYVRVTDKMETETVDKFEDYYVIQISTLGMDKYRDLIVKILVEEYGAKGVYERSDIKTREIEGLEQTKGFLTEPFDTNIEIIENGVKYIVDLENGQKTGFFLDQRDNRALVGSVARGRNVLNLFCYTGGFSIYALAAGAKHVDSVDSSKKAMMMVDRNVAINGFDESRHTSLCCDAIDYLKTAPEGKYDLMIVDPPAFAKHRGSLKNALRAYQRLNAAAISKVAPGGFVFTYSCSQVVDKEAFALAVFSAAAQCGRSVRILDRLNQPCDHSVNIYHPEGEYLKGLLLYVE